MRKYINIALGVFIGMVLIMAGLGAAGYVVPGMTNIIVVCAMAVLILNAVMDIKEGKDKGFPIFIIIIASLAIVFNIISFVLDVINIG